MYCHKCGKEIMNEALVCPSCGVPTASAMEAAARGRSIKRSTVNVLAIIHTVILVLAIIISVVYIYKYTERVNQIKDSFTGWVYVSDHNKNSKNQKLTGFVFGKDGYCTLHNVYYDKDSQEYNISYTNTTYSYKIELGLDSVHLIFDGKRYKVNMYDDIYDDFEIVESFESKDGSEVYTILD